MDPARSRVSQISQNSPERQKVYDDMRKITAVAKNLLQWCCMMNKAFEMAKKMKPTGRLIDDIKNATGKSFEKARS